MGGFNQFTEALVAWRGGLFLTQGKIGAVCVFCMWVYVCVYAHTHTHCTDKVLCCEPRGRDETPGGPKNPDRLNNGI